MIIEAMLARIGWFLGELVLLAIFVFSFFIFPWKLQEWRFNRKQLKCKHESYRETMACNAICNSCGKNLGFIGALNEKETRNNS